MDHLGISDMEPSSVILGKKTETLYPKVSKQAEAKRDGGIYSQNIILIIRKYSFVDDYYCEYK